MEHLTELQAGIVFSVRALETTGMVAANGDSIDADAVRRRVADWYRPIILLSPKMVRQPILHQELLQWLLPRGVPAGGDESMRSLTRLAVTLHTEPQDHFVAQHIYVYMHRRSERQCRFGDGQNEGARHDARLDDDDRRGFGGQRGLRRR